MEVRESGSPLLPKAASDFRDYEHARPGVEEFYRLNHTHQTLAFVLAKKKEYQSLSRRTMTVWEALEFLNTLVDWGIIGAGLIAAALVLIVWAAIRTWGAVRGTPRDLGENKRSNKFALLIGAAFGLLAICF